MPSEPPPEHVSVEFRVENERYPFVGASKRESCTFELEEMIPRGDGVYSEFFRVEGADTGRILSLAAETPKVEASVLSQTGDESLYEFEVTGGCIAVSLAERDAYPAVVRGDDGEGEVVVELPRERARGVVRDVLADHEGVAVSDEERAGRAVDGVDREQIHEVVQDVLSPRQRGVLMTALSEGFYEWPQQATLEDVAAALHTDEAAVDDQLRNCEQLVLAALFEDGTLEDSDDPAHPFSTAPGDSE